ncbi:HEPN domain-containing protein [Sandarakinorhabdus oryzae]|uniref:HEPN domain-containing protein n=1 Tax=Sandarakinorhabdus oryzae TaxID=2675220 RepID=UPI0012E318C1|nr:HEPN domain-containing protein [Sandarakinorhabdus oryzae]
MSEEYRRKLIDHAISDQPILSDFLVNSSSIKLQILGNWDFIAYSYSKAFETLWDHAKLDTSDLLLQPLLMLWRQSVELSIKAALVEIEGHIDPSLGHNIEALFARLSSALNQLGYPQNDEFTQGVHAMITEVQAFDRSADRFRYPSKRNGNDFAPVDVELDKLFQAHLLITVYCSGAGDQVAENRRIE